MILDERRGVFYLYDCPYAGGIQVRDRSTGGLIQVIPTYCGAVVEQRMAMDGSAERLYVVNGDGGGIDIVDLNSREYIDFVVGFPLNGYSPLTTNPTTGLVYQGFVILDPSKSAGDPARISSAEHPFGVSTSDLAVNPNTNLLYVVGACDGQLRVGIVDGSPGSSTFHKAIGVLSHTDSSSSDNYCRAQVAVNRHTNKIYVAARNTLHVIDGNPASPAFNTFVAHIPLLPEPTTDFTFAMAVNPIADRVYVRTANFSQPSAGKLVTIDGATTAVVTAVETTGGPYGWVMVDAASRRVFVSEYPYPNFPLTILRDEVVHTASVPTGDGTPVSISTPAATLVFSDVSSEGSVTLDPIDPTDVDLSLPGQFAIEAGLAYDISTTASISGEIALCFNVSHVLDPAVFAALRVLHGENGSWVDRTSSRDYASGIICAVTSSLSPFVVGRLEVVYGVQKLYDHTRAVRAGATLPVRVQLRGPLGENLSAADIVVKTTALRKISNATTSAVQDAGNANPDGDFRFDPSLDGGVYVFNLRTAGLSSGTYELTFVATGDSTRHVLTFQVR